MSKLLFAVLVAAGATCASAQATTIVVTPQDMAAPALNSWYLANLRDTSTGYATASSAAITNANARSGNGSVAMTLGDGAGKADFVYSWGFVEGRTLGNLDVLGYDWYRSAGGSAPAHLQPALRLRYDADGDAATRDDQGYLIWEQVYNGGGLVNQQWTSSDILAGNFWMRQLSPGHTVENYNTSLAEWIAGPRPGAPADALGANSAILGLEFGIGSGWNGSFSGYVDNVRFGFGGAPATTFNFETAAASQVPEPGSLALLGLGLAGAFFAGRRKRA